MVQGVCWDCNTERHVPRPCWWYMNKLRRLEAFAVSLLSLHSASNIHTRGKAIVFEDCSAGRVLEVYLNSSVLFGLWLVAAADHYMLLLLCQQWSLYSGDTSSFPSVLQGGPFELHQHLFDTGCFLVSISESHCSMLITVQCTFSIFMMSFFLYRSVPDSTGVFKVGTNKNQVSLLTSTHYKNIIYIHKGYRIEYI